MAEQLRQDGRRDRERGAAAVEMALTSLFLFLLIAGIVDLGRVLYTNIGVQEAAQEGAIYASLATEGDLDAGTETQIKNRVVDAVEFPVIEVDDVTVLEICPDPMGVSVTVVHEVDLITPIVGQFLGGSIELSRTVTGQAFLGECP